jgi:hypothetical protein
VGATTIPLDFLSTWDDYLLVIMNPRLVRKRLKRQPRKWQRGLVVSLFLALWWSLCSLSAVADDGAPKAGGDDRGSAGAWSVDSRFDIYSSYIFRGKRLSSGTSLQPTLQPRYKISETRSVDMFLWAHLPASGRSFSEFDGSFAFSQKYSRATFSVGHRSYLVTDADSPLKSRSELWGSLALDTMLNPVFTVFEDYSRYNQQYYDITLSHTFEKSGEDAFNVGIFSSFGYVTNGREQYRADGLVQITSGVTTDYALGVITLKPTLAYTSAADAASRNSVWGGVSLQGRW